MCNCCGGCCRNCGCGSQRGWPTYPMYPIRAYDRNGILRDDAGRPVYQPFCHTVNKDESNWKSKVTCSYGESGVK